MADGCKTIEVEVVVQENGIIRNKRGRIIARLVDDVDFSSEHLRVEPDRGRDGLTIWSGGEVK